MRKQKSKFKLVAGDKKFKLKEGQSPRGSRNGNTRPDLVIIDCYMKADPVKLSCHIQYLETILSAMQ